MTETVLTTLLPVGQDHREINPNTGQQKAYVVLSEQERSKGFKRPVRTSYLHVGEGATFASAVLVSAGTGACGSRTIMSQAIAETYARDPFFYGGTFCVSCRRHLPLSEFVWEGTTEQVGS